MGMTNVYICSRSHQGCIFVFEELEPEKYLQAVLKDEYTIESRLKVNEAQLWFSLPTII